MTKIIKSFFIVVIALAIVGGSVYPNKDFSFMVNFAKEYISPIIEVFRVANSTIGLVFGVNSIYNQYENLSSDIISELSVYIPYHLNKYDLYGRCSNQGVSVFTNKYSPHPDHKICKLYCTGSYFDDINTGERVYSDLMIFYCAVCDQIVAVFYYFPGDIENDTGDQVWILLYPENSMVSLGNFSWKILTTANTFKWSEVEEYFN